MPRHHLLLIEEHTCTRFDYHRAQTVAEAAELLAANDENKLLAGGQTLIPTLKQRLAMPATLVDIGNIADLNFIKAEGDAITIGAATKHADVASSAEVAKHLPALAELAAHIGDPAVRNRGTIGGSLANNDPAADYPAAVLGLDAKIHTNKRLIDADPYFTGMFETALEEDEIITEVTFPHPEESGLRQIPEPGIPLCNGGRFRGENAHRHSRGRHRRWR